MSARVLVVDDEPDVRILLRMILEANGFDVAEAPTGQDALDAMRRQAPEVALVDIRMPGIDGWEVLAEIRADPRLSAVKVVMISAHTSHDAQARAAEQGALFVKKPFRWEQVTNALEQALSA